MGWGLAGVGVLVAATAMTACSTSVAISTRVTRADKADYGSSWPFRADSVLVQCHTATGHAPQLLISVDSATYSLAGAAGQGLPDQVFSAHGRQQFGSLYARLITGC